MARPLRIQQAGLAYHAMARGNNKMPILLDDLDYARLLQIYADVVEDFRLDSWLYCPMPNHWHLVFRTQRPNLSAAMHRLNGRYAQWWNRRHRRVGHVFQGRFKAQIIETDPYLLRLCRYVLMNPVRARLVSRPWEWKWSSYGALAGTAKGCVDVPSLVRAIDPDGRQEVRELLIQYVEDYSDEEIAAFLRNDCRVIGSEEFARQFARRARAASKEVPARERRIGTPSLTRLLAESLQRGDGLSGGVRAAHAALYDIVDIAGCAGLSPRVVAKMVRA